MPALAPRSCHRCGKPACQEHGKKAERRKLDLRRGTAAERGYDTRWQKARKAYLAAHPLCVYAQRKGKVEAAVVVDHVKPHRGIKALFWLSSNWQPLSERAHRLKTARENGIAPCSEHGQASAEVQGVRVCRDCGGDA